MKEFAGRVAVVTGAASGIGRALGERFAALEMKVVLADVETVALEESAELARKLGAEVLTVETDVSQADSVSALAEATLDRFGGVHVVCNNAGVFAGGLSWEAPLSDYEWVIGVNVWGVIHGIRTFVPLLLEQDEGHIVNTASMAALTTSALSGAYAMSKHAVLSLSETLFHELAQKQSKVGVSALCPELIATRIGASDRNRPKHLERKSEDGEAPERDLVEGILKELTQRGAPPAKIADRVIDAIREQRFYVVPEPENAWNRACRTRLDDIRDGRNPTLDVPTDGG